MYRRQTLLSAIIATTAMTLFSYIVSDHREKNFKEPELLGKSLGNASPEISKKAAITMGWTAHYLMGLGWVVIFSKAEDRIDFKTPVSARFLFGLFSGISAVIFWRTLLKNHPDPPKTDYHEFYCQLVPAHIVFSLAMVKPEN